LFEFGFEFDRVCLGVLDIEEESTGICQRIWNYNKKTQNIVKNKN